MKGKRGQREIDEGTAYCSHCGTPVEREAQPPQDRESNSTRAIVAAVLVMILFAGVMYGMSGQGGSASVLTPTSNPVPTSASTAIPAPTTTSAPVPPPALTTDPVKTSPSASDIDDYGGDIHYPEEESYLSSYETKYVEAPKGYAINVYWMPQLSYDTKRSVYAYHGQLVTVVARQGEASCILFVDANGIKRAGWVTTIALVD